MKERLINEIKGIVIFALAVLIFVSLASYTYQDLSLYTSHPNIPVKNLASVFGAYLSGLLFFVLGWGAYSIVLFLILWSVLKFKEEEHFLGLIKVIGILVLLLSASSIFSLIGSQDAVLRFRRGGIAGGTFSNFLITYFGYTGSLVILGTLFLLSMVLVGELLISPFSYKLLIKLKEMFLLSGLDLLDAFNKFKFRKQKVFKAVTTVPKPSSKPEAVEIKSVTVSLKPKKEKDAALTTMPIKPQKIGDYKLPGLDLLEAPLAKQQLKEDLNTNAKILEETLADFGISVRVADIERGPVITRYELEPAPGVKVQKIVTLADDIALAMKAASIRIVAPIPGKSRVGVEVPNSQTMLVSIREMLSSDEFRRQDYKLPLALGKDIAGKPVVADLATMPHLLIAGTTGSGKTVCVNALIMSMLFVASPNEIKFLMVDPKMVELAVFNGLPHLLCPVVTDAKKVSHALNWVVDQMEARYKILAEAGVRNIEIYNEKFGQEKIPYIVVIIDELADLMMIAQQQIENAITRLAQLSRAVGIHLILATQRPSVDVITGVIKANFPARVSFKVASKVDSRTVLDGNGADKLLGHGDMLFLKPGESKLIRAQGSLVQDKEIERVIEFIKAQTKPVYNEEILKEQERAAFNVSDEKDDLFDEAVRLILESNQASVSILQRRMGLGHTRAARIIDMMEAEGLLGPYQGSKPRKILVDKDAWAKTKEEDKDGLNRG